jgi:hypothetical protein
VPAAKSSQNLSRLRSGAENPRSITTGPASATRSCGSVGQFGRVPNREKSRIALVLASYSSIWDSRRSHAREPHVKRSLSARTIVASN